MTDAEIIKEVLNSRWYSFWFSTPKIK